MLRDGGLENSEVFSYPLPPPHLSLSLLPLPLPLLKQAEEGLSVSWDVDISMCGLSCAL